MYEEKTNEVILDDMLNNTRDDVDKREGSIVHDMLSPAAIELSLAYIELDAVLALGFADTSEGDWLERKTSELGVYRKEAVKASGEVTFTGDEGTQIPSGTRLMTEELVYFVTTESVEIGDNGEVTAVIEAEEGGTSGNVASGDISAVLGDLADVIEVTNGEPTSGGIDVESDEALLERYYDRVRRPATSGNVYHYEQWAKEVPGVGGARVFPLWDGAGTVKVVIVDDRKRPASEVLIDATYDYIESMRPIGAEVTVESSPGKEITVTADVQLATGTDLQTVQDVYIEAINDYLETITFSENYVSYAKIGSLLLSTDGVIDYEDLKVNGGISNIALELDEAPYLESAILDVVT